MKPNLKRNLLSEVYVMAHGKGIIIEWMAGSTKFPPMYKVRLEDGSVIGQVQERHFMEYIDVSEEEPVTMLPKLVVDRG